MRACVCGRVFSVCLDVIVCCLFLLILLFISFVLCAFLRLILHDVKQVVKETDVKENPSDIRWSRTENDIFL